MDSVRANKLLRELVGKRVGKWQILSLLGHGKSAAVFKASCDGLFVAVKVFDSELVERFGRDVQIARINRELTLRDQKHEHIVQIYDGGECPETKNLYVAMQLAEWPTLINVLGDVPRTQIWPLITQLAEAARFLERAGLVHRDIKPDNVIVKLDFTRCLLLDFGVLRPIGVTGLTDGEDQRAFVGTLQYSSPEFLFRQEKDDTEGWRALTFYQLGAVLHDMIMQQRLFGQSSMPFARLVEAVKNDEPTVRAQDVPPDLVLLARNCLVKDPVLRLRLVKWEDFMPSAENTSGMAVKERIRKRVIMKRGQSGATKDERNEQDIRETRRQLEKIQSMVQEVIRHESTGADIFPPFEIHEWASPDPTKSCFCVTYCTSGEYSLSRCLRVVFSVELLDKTSRSIALRIDSCLSDQPVDPTSLVKRTGIKAFEGACEEPVVAARIKEQLYNVLDKAQQLCLGETLLPEGDVTWLF